MDVPTWLYPIVWAVPGAIVSAVWLWDKHRYAERCKRLAREYYSHGEYVGDYRNRA